MNVQPKLFLVGGAVRSHLLHMRPPSDVDFAVEGDSYEQMRTFLLDRGLKIWQERPEFVTIRGKLTLDKVGSFGGVLDVPGFRRGAIYVDADFTLCRTEAQYSDRRHPDTVTPAPLVTDLSRRDFTVNAVAVGEDGTWVDPFGGREDARAYTLRTVGTPHDRFEEDPLRMLRALRFAVTCGLTISNPTATAIWSLADLLRTLPVERVHGELQKAFRHDTWLTMAHLRNNPEVGQALRQYFPNLWLKPTLEDRD